MSEHSRLYIDRIDLWMGIAAVVVLVPFAIHNALAGRLGLSQLMGGDIAVESTPQQGSAFTLRLPLSPPVAAPQGG